MPSAKADIISGLQADILRLQGFKSSGITTVDTGLGLIKQAFPNSAFPLGAIHEFLPAGVEDTASTAGFMAGLLAALMGNDGASLWIGASRNLFPPALKSFGIPPDRVIFVDVSTEKDVLWTMEEALKCGALTAVVGEVKDLDFTASRRLQLAVEQSGVTGLVVRRPSARLNPTACVARWKIASLPGEPIDELPGMGAPVWLVELLRVRNGRPGVWEVKWINGRFQLVYKSPASVDEQKKQVG